MVSDAGLQSERTALAWTRTALAVAVAVLVLQRLMLSRVGPWSLVLLVIHLPMMLWVFLAAPRRYAASNRALLRERACADGALPLLMSAVAASLGAFELAYLCLGGG